MVFPKKWRVFFIFTLLGLLSFACVDIPNVQISIGETPTARIITATPAIPTATIFVPSPTTAATITDTPEAQPVGLDHVKIYLVALGDNGASGDMIGCGDSLVAVDVSITPTLGVLRAALTELFALEGQAYYGQSGLYNALNLSSLRVADAVVDNGTATVWLEGDLIFGGECDIPRIEEQLKATAQQFSTVDQVNIFVNAELLEDLLDLRG